MNREKSPYGKCRSCSQPVIWASMPSGKMNPIGPEPVPNGNLYLFRTPDGDVAAEFVGSDTEREKLARAKKAPTRVSHFKTCPQAGEWRKGK